MLESEQINSQAAVLEIETFRYSDAARAANEKLTRWSESLPIAFPDVAIPEADEEAHTESVPGRYGDETTDLPSQPWVFLEISEFHPGAEAEFARPAQHERDNSKATVQAGPVPTSQAPDEQISSEGLAAEIEKAEGRGKNQGIEIGLTQGREEASGELRRERERLAAQVAALLGSFAEARESCLHHLEQEAVRLALTIAARILRREAQTDPLLLIGAVRAALGQLANSTSVRLRVPATDQEMWEESLALMPGLASRPKVIGDAAMELGECRMETEIGSADLGLWAQLKTIEKGFFYRLSDPFASGGREEDTALEESQAGGENRAARLADGDLPGDASSEQPGSRN